MEREMALTPKKAQSSSSSPSPGPVSPSSIELPHFPLRYGTIIPNRIFVGGIDFNTQENDLRLFFAQHGTVKEVKIVTDRAGVSKGYGFVTFTTEEDAQKILSHADRLYFKDRELNISQAIRRQQVGPHSGCISVSNPINVIPAHGGPMYVGATDYSYTYHNGVAYFHTPEINHWPTLNTAGSPVMVAHRAAPVYPQTAIHHFQAPSPCITRPLQWSIPQCQVPSSSLQHIQPLELMYQAQEVAPDGGCTPSPMHLLEASTPEHYIDHLVHSPCHHMYAQSPVEMAPHIIQQETGQEQRFRSIRRGFPHSPVSLKARYRRGPRHLHHRKEYCADIPSLSTDTNSEPTV
ncbi:protein boule-like isoform X2 [Scleropages formosus]|uniref:protein boule-like isoform X2 n=1 Tax=Scleropages formosus TaxID=113540 RepID=UPI0008784059|nr:protein boule-like isoform X2 [Scleropages formosus]